MSDNWVFQHSVKIGQDMVNLRGDNPDQFKQVLEWATENAALFTNVQAALNAVNAVPALAGNVTSTTVQNDPPAQSGWGQPQQQAAPSWSQPATQGPACKHGPMVARSGTGAKGPWSGFFCPTSKGTPDQCPPQFNKR